MAPYPEELDVFSVPHSRMKELIAQYCDLLQHTNFSNGIETELLLQSLHHTFSEFKSHEQIENRYIMTQLRNKLDALSIQNTAVCNCHKDNRLTEMMNLLSDGYHTKDKTMRERINYGIKLKNALEDFTKDFLPHMKEEEEVFQPLLMKYFSYEELQALRKKVIREHSMTWNEEKYSCDEKEPVVEEVTNKEVTEKEEEEEVIEGTSALDLPPEIMMKIFSHLTPKELCRSAQVCRSWSEVAMDGKLWDEVSPVRWAQGQWQFHFDDTDEDDDEDFCDYEEDDEAEYLCLDEDRDIDESGSSDDSSDESDNLYVLKRESKILQSLAKYVLPKVGWGVKTLCLANSKALTNSLLNKMLSHCPNLEHLNLTQTTVADSAFKSIVKNNSCSKLKTLILSGCENITDVALIRLSNALSQNPVENTEEPRETKNDVSQNEYKEYRTFSDKNVKSKESLVQESEASHTEDCCSFGCGCRLGLNLGTKMKMDKISDFVDCGAYSEQIGTVNDGEIDKEPLSILDSSDPGGIGRKDLTSSTARDGPGSDEVPPDLALVDVEDCAENFVRQRDGELRRTDLCNDPRCPKFSIERGKNIVEKCVKIHLEDDNFVETVPKSVAGDRDKNGERADAMLVNSRSKPRLEDHVRSSDSRSRFDESRGDLPPNVCDGQEGAIGMDNFDEGGWMEVKQGPVCDEAKAELPSNISENDPGALNVYEEMGVCCKILEELQMYGYGKSPLKPSGGDGEVQEYVAAEICTPSSHPASRVFEIPGAVSADVSVQTGPHVLNFERLWQHANFERTFDSDLDTKIRDLDPGKKSTWKRRTLQLLDLSGCFRITDVGIRSLMEDGGLPHLCHLDLSGCYTISGACLTDFISSCPSLDYEKFYYCDNILDGPLAAVANGCQNLSCRHRVCCRSGFYLYN